MNDAPDRIFAETEPYDFPGYSPCWVWHNADGMECEADDLPLYLRADIAARREADAYRAGLEAAAKVAEDAAPVTQDWHGDVVRGACEDIAAAIRAMKDDTPEPPCNPARTSHEG